MDTTNLIAWLLFDNSPTEDLCGNTWTAVGNPTVGTSGAIFGNALQLDGSNYLKMDGGITLGGQDFTIRGWATMDAGTVQSWGGLFALDGNNLRIIRYNTLDNAFEIGYKRGLARVNLPASLTSRFFFELDYQHSTGKWFTFFNGALVHTYTNSLARTTYSTVFVGGNGDNDSGGNKWSGSIDEFQIYDGVALHTENFTPPTADDYWVDGATANVTVDVQRKVHNPPLEWRYENAGDADDLILTAPILRDLPATQSKTGTAFYQTTRAKCFDLPATSEVWMKFDVYCNGSQRWRAYNGGNNSATGLTVQTSGELDYFCSDNEVYNVSGVAARLRVQTILVHMISGSSDGIIEAWADGNFIYKYTGDVNHGQDFADIYLQSDGSGTFFSNVIISNAPIDLDEDVSQGEVLKVDVQRNVTNSGTVLADVQRRIILPGEVTIDLQRVITNETSQILVDVQRRVTNAGTLLADVQRAVTNSGAVLVDVQRNVRNVVAGEVAIDIQRRVTNSGEFTADIQRILTCTGELFADVELNITRDWLTRILPESSFLDEKMYASAKALDVEISKLFADTRQVLHLPRLDELDGLILDILADQLHVDNYDAINFDTATKKNLIRRSIAWHRIKGTPGAVQMVLEDAFRALRIDEWFEYGGEPYYFRIYCRGYLSTPEQFGAYWRMLFDSKNVRSHLERVIIDLTEDEPIRLYTGVARFNCGQRRVKLRRPKDYVLNVDTGILKFVRGTRTVGMKDWEPLYPLADGDWLRLYFNFPTGRDHPVLLSNPQDELTKGAIRDVGTNAADNVIFMNQFAEGTLGVDRAALIKGFTVTEKNDDKVLPKDGSLRLFWAFPKGNKHKMLLHNQKGNVTLGEIRRLGLSAANDDLLRNAYNQQTSGISHVALVKNFIVNDDNRDEKVGFEE